MSAPVASIALPRILRVGAGAADQLADVLAALDLSRPLVVTDGFLASSGVVARISDGLERRGITFSVFDRTRSDPTTSSISGAVEMLSLIHI